MFNINNSYINPKRYIKSEILKTSSGLTIPCALPLFYLPGDWVRVWGYSGRGTEQKKGGKAHRFSQLYEIKLAPLSKRPPLEFPFSSRASLEFPTFRQTPSS